MWSRFGAIQRLHESQCDDEDEYFVAVAEFTLWAVIVDEGFSALLQGLTAPSGEDYTALRDASADGRHVSGLRWARHKISHCVARPVHDGAGVLGEDFVLGESTLGPDFRWLPREVVLSDSVDPRNGNALEVAAYDDLLAHHKVYETVLACIRWLAEVRYDYRDPNWARRWFDAQTTPVGDGSE